MTNVEAITLVVSTIGLVISILSATVTYYIGRNTINTANRDTVMSAIIGCNDRYEHLNELKDEIERDYLRINSGDIQGNIDELHVKQNVQNYFRRYWALKSDQIDYWMLGYIDADSLITWLLSMFDAFLSDKKVGRVSYINSWEDSKEGHELLNPTMCNIINDLKSSIGHGYDKDNGGKYSRLFAIMLKIENDKKREFQVMRKDNLSFIKLKNSYAPKVRSQIDREVAVMGSNDRP